ncbi:heavy metal translocating P-type ATPase [Enterococcus sp. LJL120]
MEKTYELKNLDCGNCATKIETAVKKIDGVQAATVNFVQTKMAITCPAEDFAKVEKQAQTIIHELEPDVEMIDLSQQSEEHQHDDSHLKKDIWRVALSFVALIILSLANLNDLPRLIGFLLLYGFIGGDVVLTAVRNIIKGQVFDEHFLMAVATIGAMLIGEYPEAVAVMLFYQVGELFQSVAVGKSRKSIKGLLAIRPDYANLMTATGEQQVAPQEVAVGAEIIVKPGERVPLDGIISNGETMVDTSALTGEAVPRKLVVGDQILSGFVNQTGVIQITVEKNAADSTVSRILDLVENASSKKAPAENFITKFSRIYTPVVVILALLLAVVPPLLFQQAWSEWIYRGLTFLVISCPCALVVSVPLTFFGGIGGASKAGVLVKGSNYLELLSQVETVVFDKTGTLTKGVFEVQEVATSLPKKDFLRLAASVEANSNHPIALSILKAYDGELLPVEDIQEISGAGVLATINQKRIAAGNLRLMAELGISVPKVATVGTIIYVAEDNEYFGYLIIADEVKADTQTSIQELHQAGIKQTVMLTGDNQKVGTAIAEKLGIDQVYGDLLPEGKVEKLEELMATNQKIAFVGDGMNDAPVLARADLGIAMGGLGSDAAIEAADVVIMNDAPSLIPKAIAISKKTLRIVKQNIIFSIGIKVLVLALGAVGFASMGAAVFADVGVTLIAVLNAMRALRTKN